MGWDFCSAWTTVKIAKAAITRELETNGYKVLKTATSKKEFWVAYEKDGNRSIMLFLLAKEGYGWGYKSIHEDEGPYYYECPVALLDLCPDTSKRTASSANWRASVRARAAATARVFNAGERVTVYGQNYEVVGPYKTGKYLIKNAVGKVYQIRTSEIEVSA